MLQDRGNLWPSERLDLSRSFGASLRAVARAAARAERERQQTAARSEAARLRAIRTAATQAKANANEAARLYALAQAHEADVLTAAVRARETAVDNMLSSALARDPAVDLGTLFKPFIPGKFDERPWRSSPPTRDWYKLEPPSFLSRVVPGHAKRYQRRIDSAKLKFDAAEAQHLELCRSRLIALEEFHQEEEERKRTVDRENGPLRDLQQRLQAIEHSAVVEYCRLMLSRSLSGAPDALSVEVGYSAESKHLVVDLELPEFEVIPEEVGFKYVKSGDRIDPIPRPISRRKAMYSNLISQIALKCVDAVFRGVVKGSVDCLTLNGMLETVDPATGQEVRLCLLSVRVTADVFATFNLGQVQPEQCLRSLKASVSRSPTELLAVRPIVELDMVDPRFVQTSDVLSKLDARQNLMELTPTEFEGLITNLFGTMGLETRQTRPSRDGGVDCVAFDPRPIFGGKVVIQAKRYRNTVGVSAVRDLFGTVQNEGASKGILVTTSGYGKAAFDFAAGKPLELLDGGNLLHLLAEHASVDARIVMPKGWADLPVHGE